MTPDVLKEHRRKRRNAKTYRYQKKRRKQVKEKLIDALGGSCADCGYKESLGALEFHHLDAGMKEFAISKFIAQLPFDKVLAEARKCVLLCANCHRLRHAAASEAKAADDPVVAFRRPIKAKAVALSGGTCAGCGRLGPNAVFEFHHRDAKTKEFGIGQDGVPRSWERIVAELAKCVMLCANCHREVHAGVRTLDAGLAEDAVSYAA
jgi:hypothetical protein